MIAAALIATTARELANSRSAGERRHARERGLRRTVELLTLARIDPRTSPAARHLAIVRALAPAFEP